MRGCDFVVWMRPSRSLRARVLERDDDAASRRSAGSARRKPIASSTRSCGWGRLVTCWGRLWLHQLARRSSGGAGGLWFRSAWRCSVVMRTAAPTQTRSTPSAMGSSVPAWPTRRTPLPLRTRPMTLKDVRPRGLLKLRMPAEGDTGGALIGAYSSARGWRSADTFFIRSSMRAPSSIV